MAESARTTQLLQAAFDVIDATLASHRHREDGFKSWNRHIEWPWYSCGCLWECQQTSCTAVKSMFLDLVALKSVIRPEACSDWLATTLASAT
jgi:hypothetical protein